MTYAWGFIKTVVLLLVLCQPVAAEHYSVLTEQLAPVHFEEDGEVKGIATEIVQAIFKEANLAPEIEVFPWKRAYAIALKEKNTFIYTINRTEKRENLFKWIGPILSKETNLYKLKSRTDIQIKSIDDVKNYTTAVILGHSLTTKLLTHGFTEGKELITTTDKKQQIKLLLKGNADLVTGNQYTIYNSLKAAGHSMEDVEPVFLITKQGYYLGANKNTDDALINQLEEANEKIQNSVLIPELIRKYIY